ncbi:MAG: hypothetical protein HY666_02885 [Chloroflexi bacterium]|nr:hypothetical protein [Chloroflexota bacterium]
MGTFRHRIEVIAPDGRRREAIEAVVDDGATYTWLPRSLLQGLGIPPAFRFPFAPADGIRTEREVAEARVRLDGQVRTTLVVFGDEGTVPVLGAHALEAFGVTVDPVNRRLVSTPVLLLGFVDA